MLDLCFKKYFWYCHSLVKTPNKVCLLIKCIEYHLVLIWEYTGFFAFKVETDLIKPNFSYLLMSQCQKQFYKIPVRTSKLYVYYFLNCNDTNHNGKVMFTSLKWHFYLYNNHETTAPQNPVWECTACVDHPLRSLCILCWFM